MGKREVKDYTDEELRKITVQWEIDKARVKANPDAFGYYYDRDREYIRYLNNENLQVLFRHVSYLFRGHVENSMFLYPNEIAQVLNVYRRIIKYGYYSRSKDEEKRVRKNLAKAVSRQSYRRLNRNTPRSK